MCVCVCVCVCVCGNAYFVCVLELIDVRGRGGNLGEVVVMVVLGLLLLGKDDAVLKEERLPPVFGPLHDGEVSLTQDLALLLQASLQRGGGALILLRTIIITQGSDVMRRGGGSKLEH